ncbi:MAG: hypothetical protein WAT39_02190 [Planctomycetota bacterium]
MPHLRCFACVVLAIGLSLLGACGQKAGTPGATVERFLGAIRDGDDATARGCMVADERGDKSVSFDAEGLANGYRIGTTKVEGGRATVGVTVDGKELPMALRREDAQWRISMNDTMQAMLGMTPAQMEKAFEQAARQLGDQVQKGMEKALRDGLAAPAGR